MIAPAVHAFRPEGTAARGPSSAGRLVHARARPRHDAALVVDHDRGPVETIHFGGAVKLTAGRCIVRISPDLGTTLDAAQLGAGVPRP